ncbi:MAG TPA: cysteine desulfurase [Chlamydiales bacterium]|nr:cysteine desulfurase [Chlamydiales bacterium]
MRKQFPIFDHHPELIYLDSAATAHKPRCVIDALTQFYSSEYATVHRSIYRSSLLATEKYNATRETAQKFLNALHTDEIVFTRGTTDAINLVAASYGKTHLKPNDEILISPMEHHSNIVPWQMLAQQTGAQLRYIPMNSQGVLEWHASITPRTKIIALAHISNVTGTINPIHQIARAAHANNAILLVDGAQAAPHMPIDVQALDCDFYAFSGHKCYGPTGVGVLYGKKHLLNSMPPIQGGGDMIERVDLLTTTYQKPPLRFEAGTPLIGPVIALKAALDFITQMGRPQISAHTQTLLLHATNRLQSIPNLKIIGTAPDKGPILTFTIASIHPLDIATLLDLKNIAIRSGHLCAQPLLRAFQLTSAARASFALYNTLEEVDLFANALESLIPQLIKS